MRFLSDKVLYHGFRRGATKTTGRRIKYSAPGKLPRLLPHIRRHPALLTGKRGVIPAVDVRGCCVADTIHNPSVSFADSSLYTREPGALAACQRVVLFWLPLTRELAKSKILTEGEKHTGKFRREQAPALRLAGGS